MTDEEKAEDIEMIIAIASYSKVRIDRIVLNYEELEKQNKALVDENRELKAQIIDIKEDVERERNKQRRLENDFTTAVLNSLLQKWALAK